MIILAILLKYEAGFAVLLGIVIGVTFIAAMEIDRKRNERRPRP